MAYNPFDTLQRNFSLKPTSLTDQASGGQDMSNTVTTAQKSQVAIADQLKAKAMEVILPKHLYIPEGAESVDLRRVVNLPDGMIDYELFSFTAPQGAIVKFISYGIFNDGDNGVNFNFKPLVDGSRVFRYHGDPTQNFKIYLGLGPDLSNTAMLPCQLTLQPNQTIQWLISNTSGVDTSMGVRMIGYLDTTSARAGTRFGG